MHVLYGTITTPMHGSPGNQRSERINYIMSSIANTGASFFISVDRIEVHCTTKAGLLGVRTKVFIQYLVALSLFIFDTPLVLWTVNLRNKRKTALYILGNHSLQDIP